jgi:hypothetical protein
MLDCQFAKLLICLFANLLTLFSSVMKRCEERVNAMRISDEEGATREIFINTSQAVYIFFKPAGYTECEIWRPKDLPNYFNNAKNFLRISA